MLADLIQSEFKCKKQCKRLWTIFSTWFFFFCCTYLNSYTLKLEDSRKIQSKVKIRFRLGQTAPSQKQTHRQVGLWKQLARDSLEGESWRAALSSLWLNTLRVNCHDCPVEKKTMYAPSQQLQAWEKNVKPKLSGQPSPLHNNLQMERIGSSGVNGYVHQHCLQKQSAQYKS